VDVRMYYESGLQL